ncbi:hypothetical protein SDC9_145065 [bioreactor metagenome]|uniref:Uncharacterized protein n=1 Tax=bioreactor metagenome TaxID=1076179 RepID=A0A645E8S7_9ZZZZ
MEAVVVLIQPEFPGGEHGFSCAHRGFAFSQRAFAVGDRTGDDIHIGGIQQLPHCVMPGGCSIRRQAEKFIIVAIKDQTEALAPALFPNHPRRVIDRIDHRKLKKVVEIDNISIDGQIIKDGIISAPLSGSRNRRRCQCYPCLIPCSAQFCIRPIFFAQVFTELCECGTVIAAISIVPDPIVKPFLRIASAGVVSGHVFPVFTL